MNGQGHVPFSDVSPGFAAACERIVERILRLPGIRVATISLVDADGTLRVFAELGGEQFGLPPQRGRVIPGGTLTARTVSEGQPQWAADVLSDPHVALPDVMRAVIAASEVRAFLAVPLAAETRLIGALTVGDTSIRDFSAREVALLQIFADQAAVALESTRLAEQAAGRQRQAELLARLAAEINRSLNLETVLRRIVHRAQELCGSEVAGIALRDADSGTIPFRYWSGLRGEASPQQSVQPGESLEGPAFLTGFLRTEGVASEIAAPIRMSHRTEGLLYVGRRDHRPFTDEDQTRLVQLTDHAAIAIRNAQRFAALRASESRYREMVENANDIVFTVDLAGNLTSANRAAERLSGYTCPGTTGHLVTQYLSPGSADHVRTILEAATSGTLLPVYEIELLAPDGRVVPLEVSVCLVRAHGRPVELQGIARDVSERRRLEQRLVQSQKMEALGRLAAGVAHDFNNLLVVILGQTDLFERSQEPSDSLQRGVDRIRAAAERAARLTSQLLDFSRPRAIELTLLDLNELIPPLVALLDTLLGRHITITTVLTPGLGKIRAAVGHIEQVIMNLAINARDAMPSGGRLELATANVELDEAFVRCCPGLAPGPYVMLTLSDTGVGMTADVKARIFEPFFTTKGPARGTGLGLSMVYRIVTQYRGAVLVDSEPGQGTTFRLYVPRVEHADGSGESTPPPRPSEEVVTLPGAASRARVLVADDEPAIRALLREYLGDRLGYEIILTDTAIGALALARARQPHVVLLDLTMPGAVRGEAVIHAISREAPVIVITAATDVDLARITLAHGAFDFVSKPFNLEELRDTVAAAILHGRNPA